MRHTGLHEALGREDEPQKEPEEEEGGHCDREAGPTGKAAAALGHPPGRSPAEQLLAAQLGREQ
jgi:hypothetical protein